MKRWLPLIALLTAAASACTEWHTHPLPPGPGPMSGRVRVTLVSGERVELTRLQLGTDSLYGEHPNDASHERVAVAVADVAYTETPQVSASGIAVLSVAALLAFLRWYLLPHILGD